MSRRKVYTVSWFDPGPPRRAVLWSAYRHNQTRRVPGYSEAVKTAKRLAGRFGVAILWDQDGIREPGNDGLDHSYIHLYVKGGGL